MASGKIRHSNHITDERALRYLKNLFPVEWVQREMTPDYGIDIDLELFGYENELCVTLGEHVFLQVKGTEHAKYRAIHPFGRDIYSDEEAKKLDLSVLTFQIETSLIKLVERMGSTIPVLLVVVDLVTNKAYYICLNDYIRSVLPYQKPNWSQQDSVMIYIPTENSLGKDNTCICLWYGKRTKLYGLFQELLTLIDDVSCLDGESLVEKVRLFFDQNYCADSWRARDQWPMLASLYDTMIEMRNNSMIDEKSQDILMRFVPDNTDPLNVTVFFGVNEIEKSAFATAQAISCKHFLDCAKSLCSTFENNVRHVGLPTQFNWLQNN